MKFKLLFEKLLLINNNNLYENSKIIELLKYKNKEEIEKWLINYEELNKFCETKKHYMTKKK